MPLKSEPADSQPENNSALDAIVAEYLLAVERGEQPDRDEYLKNHPDFAKALHSFFANLDATCIVAPTGSVPRDYKTEIVLNSRYRLIKQIGEGGMGSVWSADQLQPVKRRVAIKLIKAGTDSREVMARFEAERQALAMMDHENIAKVFDAGTTDDRRPYFVMELVNGIPITDYCDQGKLSLNERLLLFIQCCKAIQHAHQKGIIHRDIKPGNILVSQQDGTAVVKVIDFGLAKALNVGSLIDDSMFTQQGQILGTLRYMSPEQAELITLDIDTRTDVFSLGVVLYELLTGSTPIQKDRIGKTPVDRVLAAIREEEAPRPSSRLSSLGDSASEISSQRQTNLRKLGLIMKGDLDWIAMKALEKDRTRRYDSPAQMAEDVQRYLNSEAIIARPPSFTYRLKKVTRKHRVAVTTAALTLSLLIAGIIATTTQMLRAQKAETATGIKADEVKRESVRASNAEAVAKQDRDKAQAAEAAAIKSEAATEKTLARANYFLAIDRWEDNLAGEAIDYLEKIPSAHRHFEWHLARNEFEGSELTLYGHYSPVRCVDFSPDGKLVASIGNDREIRLWDAKSGDAILTIAGQYGLASALRFSPDGTMLAVFRHDERLTILNSCNGNTIRTLSTEIRDRSKGNRFSNSQSGGNHSIDWSSDGTRLASSHNDNTVKLWNVVTGDIVQTLTGHSGEVSSVSFSGDAKKLVSGSADNVAIIWDLNSGSAIMKLQDRMSGVACVTFSKDGKFIACTSTDLVVRLWSAKTGELLWKCPRQVKQITDCVFSPDGALIATTSNDATTKLWDVATGKEIRTLIGHKGPVADACFSPDGSRLTTAGDDQTIKLWNVSDATGHRTLDGHGTGVSNVHFRPESQQLASSGADGRVFLWDTATERFLRMFAVEHSGLPVQSMSFSPDGSIVASGDSKGIIQLWNVDSGRLWGTLSGHEGAILNMEFSKDGQLLVSGSSDVSARVWNIAEKKEIMKLGGRAEKIAYKPNGSLAGHVQGVFGVSFGLDGASVATIGGEGSIIVWDVASGESMNRIDPVSPTTDRTVVPEMNSVAVTPIISVTFDHCISYSPDGRYLVSNSSQNPIERGLEIWDSSTAKELRRATGSSGSPLSISVSPDSTRIATGGRDKSVRIWDAETGDELRRCEGHIGSVNSVAFSPDGNQLASAGIDSNIKLWSAFSEYETTAFKGHSKQVECSAISSSGRRILSGDSNGTIKVWDAWTGKLERSIEGYSDPVRMISELYLSADGSRAISVGWNEGITAEKLQGPNDRIKLWDTTTGRELPLMAVHVGNRVAISFSPDSSRIVTGGQNDKTLHVWDATTGLELRSLPEQEAPILKATFSADSARVIAKDTEGRIKVWNAITGEAVAPSESDLTAVTINNSPTRTLDGRWQVIHRGNDVLLIDQHFKTTERERKRREAAARPKIRWHEEQRAKAIQSANEFAEAFHQSWLEKYSQHETHGNDVTANSKPSLAPLLTKSDRLSVQSQFAESSLHLLKTEDFQSNNPFTRMNAMYVDKGRAIIRSDGGWWGWHIGEFAENQMLKAKVRVRHNTSGRVGISLTQSGDHPGALLWLSGDQMVTRSASMFAKNKPPQLDREFYAPDIINPAEEWNEIQLALQNGSLHIFINDVHVDTMEFLSSEPPTPANVSFSIQSDAAGTMVEMESFSIHVIESKQPPSIWPDDAPKLAIRDFNADQAKRHQEEWAKYLSVPVEYTNSLGMKFQLIPPGEFLMGSSEQEIASNLQLVSPDDIHSRNCVTSEAPQHLVRLTRPYYLSIHEVTQKQYQAVMGVNPSNFSSNGDGRDAVREIETSNFPVEMVNYHDAMAFMKKLEEMELAGSPEVTSMSHYRLPSEAEWEFAARAGDHGNMNGSRQASNATASRQFMNAEGRTGPVGEFSQNAFGLHDTLGNVWEWCGDSWATDDFTGLQLKVTADPVRSPTAPGMRITKGGSWRDTPLSCRPADRHSAGDGFRYYAIGFRPLLEVKHQKAETPEADTPAGSRPQK